MCPVLDVDREPSRVESEEKEGGGEGVVKVEENRLLAEVVKRGATACDQLEGAESVLAYREGVREGEREERSDGELILEEW